MKHISFIILFALIAFSAYAVGEDKKTTRFYGKITPFSTTDKLAIWQGREIGMDTIFIPVSAKGEFSVELSVKEPETKSFLIFYERETAHFNAYFKPGKDVYAEISCCKEEKVYKERTIEELVAHAIFKGATKRECEFVNETHLYDFKVYDENGRPVGFNHFRKQMAETQKKERKALKKLEPELTQRYQFTIDDIPNGYSFVYGWTLLNDGHNPDSDPDFKKYVDQIDWNDERSMNLNYADVHYPNAAMKILYRLRTNNTLYPRLQPTEQILSLIRDSISSTSMRQILSDHFMNFFLGEGGSDDMENIMVIYRQLSSGTIYENNLKSYQRIKSLQSGIEAKDFTVTDLSSNSISLKELLKKKRYTFVDFWASWCVPCRKEIKYLKEIFAKYKDSPQVQFVSISIDRKEQDWRDALAKDQPEWQQYLIEQSQMPILNNDYGISAIPRFILFNDKGKLLDIKAPNPSDSGYITWLEKWLKK